MSTTSRRLSLKTKTAKNSHTPGRDKGENCQRSPLKIFGMNANPYKLRGARAEAFLKYSSLVRSMNK